LAELSDMAWIRDWAPRVASHWHDDLVIATAVEGEVDYLLTRDKELRAVGEYEDVKIRTPQEFLEEFEGLG
jgi:predicted nucleic acid-binding protein